MDPYEGWKKPGGPEWASGGADTSGESGMRTGLRTAGTVLGAAFGGPAGAAVVGGLFDLGGIGLAYGMGDDESKYESYRADLVRRERDYASQDKLIGRREWLQAQRKRASEGMPKQVKEAQTLAALIGQSAIEAGPPVRDADEVLADLPAAVRGDFSGMDDEDHEDFWTVLQRKRDTDPYAGGDPYASALYYAGVGYGGRDWVLSSP
jgi:hypothetical protein